MKNAQSPEFKIGDNVIVTSKESGIKRKGKIIGVYPYVISPYLVNVVGVGKLYLKASYLTLDDNPNSDNPDAEFKVGDYVVGSHPNGHTYSGKIVKYYPENEHPYLVDTSNGITAPIGFKKSELKHDIKI